MNKMLLAAICAILSFAGLGGEALQAQQLNGSIYLDGKLADDWFTTGEKWHIAMKRFGYPSQLVIRIYSSDCPIPNPYGNQVYYDLPVEKGCVLKGAKAVPEYSLNVL